MPSAAAPGPLSRDRLTAHLPRPHRRDALGVGWKLALGSPGALETILSTLLSRPLSRICSTLHEPTPAVLPAHKYSSSDTAIIPRPACRSLSPPHKPPSPAEIALSASSWHSLHLLLMRWRRQMLDPPHSLQWLLWRWCGQMLAPPQSLQVLLMR